jgi:two-component system response regulator HydG
MHEPKAVPRILIVDDDPVTGPALHDHLRLGGYACDLSRSGEAALASANLTSYSLVICGVRIAAMDELELLDRLKRAHPSLPVIIVTATRSVEEAVDVIKRGAFQYLEKSVDLAELCSFVVEATTSSEREVRSTRPGDGDASAELVQASPAMRTLLQAVSLVALSSAPVLVMGESGTGKERIARAIHERGPRKGRPFVAINMSAIPEQLLESELFGHQRGAFSGATQARKGVLSAAHGGTVLLDEIGDMPLSLQPKLLRALQFGEIRAVGSDRTERIDIRVIAATHRDLNALVRAGRFREDLLYRMNVIPLIVPPLRSRREDIPLLALAFLKKARERSPASPVKSISDEAMQVLTEATWTGNVRELESTLERLVVLGRDAMIVPGDLTFIKAAPREQAWSTTPAELDTLKQLSERYLAWVLVQTGGDKRRAAHILGIDLSTLYRWQRK